jgi:hypothetical protein
MPSNPASWTPEMATAYQRERRAAARAAGLCGTCLKRRPRAPFVTCKPCRVADKARRENSTAT